MGKTKRGKGCKIMAIADGHGLPVAVCTTSASPAEVKLVRVVVLPASVIPEITQQLNRARFADLNALNAVMAIIKWKKLKGLYRDLEREYHSTHTTDGNMLNLSTDSFTA